MNKKIIAFSQVTRCGGVTINALLQSYFGLKHFDLVGEFLNNQMTYAEKDLLFDLKIHPFSHSFAGHFSSHLNIDNISKINNKSVMFYTMLRNPIDRVFSKYRFQVNRYNLPNDFNAWFKKYHIPNGMINHFVGSDNLELAKEILTHKYTAVGILEKFDESLLIFKKKLSLEGMNLNYKIKNDTIKLKSDEQKKIEDKYREMVISSNINDLKLYEYVLNTIWKEQVKDYNSDKLKSDLIKEFSSKNYRFNERISSYVKVRLNKTYHHFFYKPISKLRYKLK
jgi:hypothetical protein